MLPSCRSTVDALTDFLKNCHSQFEQVGFVLTSGEVVEVKNVCKDPTNGFVVSGEDLLRYSDDVVATWHTHPGATSNLSMSDYESFKNWPQWRHFIAGSDGVAEYYVEDGELLRASL
jgi:proteasome lid subunit RPN8/RPN11